MPVAPELLNTVTDMIGEWTSEDVLGTLSMNEGFILADLLTQLGAANTGTHILREVWEGETDGDRDPLPWVNAAGNRMTGDQYDGQAGYRFAPRA